MSIIGSTNKGSGLIILDDKKRINEYKSAFLNRYVFHIRTVQNNMILLENNLSKLNLNIKSYELFERSFFHDTDKLQPNMICSYFKISEYYYKKNNGIEVDFSIENHKEKTERHYETQRHHFYKNDITPTDVDICEMCCDVSAISIEKNEEDNTHYYRNFMLKDHKKLVEYNDKALKIFHLIWELVENPSYENEEKYKFIKIRLEQIRNFQNVMIFLEKNINRFMFDLTNYEKSVEEYDLLRRAFLLDRTLILQKNDDFCIFNGEIVNPEDVCALASEVFSKYIKSDSAEIENYLKSKNISVIHKKDVIDVVTFLEREFVL